MNPILPREDYYTSMQNLDTNVQEIKEASPQVKGAPSKDTIAPYTQDFDPPSEPLTPQKKLSTLERIEDIEVFAEQKLNITGYVPLLSSFSGAVRCIMGKLQIAIGIVCAPANAILGFCAQDEKVAENYFSEAKRSTAQIFHGIFNFFRGIIEIIPFVGNGLTFAYDRAFGFRQTYAIE
jgi:hypothetical protein